MSARNRKRHSVAKMVCLIVGAWFLTAGALIYVGESSQRHGYAVKLPGGLEIRP